MLTLLATDRRSISQNMGKRSEDMRPIYEEYLCIMDAVKEKMCIASLTQSPEQAHAAALKANEVRVLEGKTPNGTNAAHWPTWVPPRMRDAFTTKLSATYTRTGQRQGTRFIPFTTSTHRKYTKQVTDNTLVTIKRIRSTHATDTNGTSGYTPYRALHLAAARMAEKALYTRLKGYELGTHNTIDHPLPVNWLALLDAPMRARLREAQVNPNAVSLEGLDHFYEPPRGIDPGEALPELADEDKAHAQEHGLELLTDTDDNQEGEEI